MIYDRDFYAWTVEQANLLRSGPLSALDREHLAQEIDAMGRSEKRALCNRLTVLLTHLLKWQFQPNLRSRSWRLTIKEQRLKISSLLKDSPSLSYYLSAEIHKAYQLAIIRAERETGLSLFPETCPFPDREVLSDYLPE